MLLKPAEPAISEIDAFVFLVHLPGSFQNAVFQKVFKGCSIHNALKAAAAFTFADKYGICDILKRNGFSKVLMNIGNSAFHTLLILRKNVWWRSVTCWKIVI